jgi:hypothetical protein
MAGRRINVHDLDFADIPSGVVYGPLEVSSPDAVREALRRFAAAYPEHRLFAGVERTRFGARWYRRSDAELDDLCSAMVTAVAPDPDPDEMLARICDFSFDRGAYAHYWVGQSFIASARSHLLGDAQIAYVTPLIVSVAAGAPVPELRTEPDRRMPLTRAALSWYGRHPKRLVDSLLAPKPQPHPSGESLVIPRRWRFTAVGRTVPQPATAALRQWRERTCPQASMANTWSAAIWAAFEAAGVPFASRGFRTLVNARRYLPEGTTVTGNFSAAIYLEPTDPADPVAVEYALRRNLDSGRPLLAMAASGLKQALPARRASRLPDVQDVDRRPTLTISFVGRRRDYEELPVDTEHVYHYSASGPEGPSGITVICSIVHDHMALSASFCEDVVDRAPVVAALEALVADPLAGLVASPRTLVR